MIGLAVGLGMNVVGAALQGLGVNQQAKANQHALGNIAAENRHYATRSREIAADAGDQYRKLGEKLAVSTQAYYDHRAAEARVTAARRAADARKAKINETVAQATQKARVTGGIQNAAQARVAQEREQQARPYQEATLDLAGEQAGENARNAYDLQGAANLQQTSADLGSQALDLQQMSGLRRAVLDVNHARELANLNARLGDAQRRGGGLMAVGGLLSSAAPLIGSLGSARKVDGLPGGLDGLPGDVFDLPRHTVA